MCIFFLFSGAVGTKGHTFSVRTNAAEQTMNECIQDTLPVDANSVKLYFTYVGKHEHLGRFEMNEVTGLPKILYTNNQMFEIDLQVLGIYIAVLLDRQIPVYQGYKATTDPAKLFAAKNIVKKAWDRIYCITDEESAVFDKVVTATVAGAPNNVTGVGDMFSHSFLESDHILADLDTDRLEPKDIITIMSNIPTLSKTAKPVRVVAQSRMLNEYTELSEIMSGLGPLNFLNGWPYIASAVGNISDEVILNHLLHQGDHSILRNHAALIELFNFQKQRKIVSRTVSNIWKRDPDSVKRIGAILNAHTPRNLNRILKDTKCPEARQLAQLLKPLCRKLSHDIPYSNQSGALQITISLAYGRFFGTGILFLTCNPSITKQPIFPTFLEPLADNNIVSPAIRLQLARDYEALSLSERKMLQIQNPAASAKTYLHTKEFILASLLQFAATIKGKVSDTKIMRAPWRTRASGGIFGPIMAALLTNELSDGQNNHFHALLLVPFDYQYCASIAENGHQNMQFGDFMNSIIVTEYPSHVVDTFRALKISKKRTG